jgi:peptide/nickel transport system ATP-binding protein
MNNILEVEGLRVRFGSGRDALVAVDGIDIRLPRGGTLGLVGESGCGKSTIARALTGLVPVASGVIRLDGMDCSAQSARDARAYRRRLQMVFQDPYSSLNPRMTIGEMIGEAVALRGAARRSGAERRRECARALELVGMSDSALDRFPHQFSGGQRQRIAIARALAVGPEVVVHDEVTSSLDVSTQSTILNLLKTLQRDLGLSYILISHDLSVVRLMSDMVAVMYLGRIVECAPTEQLFHDPSHPYTRALISSLPRLEDHRRPASLKGDLPNPRQPPVGCRFNTRCPVGPLADPSRSVCLTVDPQAAAGSKRNFAACHFSSPTASVENIRVNT